MMRRTCLNIGSGPEHCRPETANRMVCIGKGTFTISVRQVLLGLCVGAGLITGAAWPVMGQEPVTGQAAPTDSAADTAADSDPAPEAESAPAEETPSQARLRSLLEPLQQPGDGAVELRLSEPLEPSAENRRKALALYMSGRSLEREKKFQEAYDAYVLALGLDGKSIKLYEALIPLAFRLDKADEGIAFTRLAVELDPNNFELLSQLGIYAMKNQSPRDSIEYFQKAVTSDNVDKKSGPYISIMGQLGVLYLAMNETGKAAEAFEVVFQAITNSKAYNIDFRTLQALETLSGSKADTFERFGELFLMTDRLELARSAFDKAKQAARGNSAVYSLQLARVLNKEKKYEEARQKLQEYFDAKLSSKGRVPYLLLAELLTALQQEDQILPELQKLAEADEKNEPLQLFLAERYIAADELDAAEKIYEKYTGGNGNGGEIQLGLLQIYRKREVADKAVPTLAQAMLNGANTPRLEAELELLAQNESLADQMIELGRKDEEAGDARQMFAQHYLLAKLAMQRKNYDAVIDLYQRAMEIRGERQILLTLYGELIQFLAVEEQYDACVDVIEEAIDNPTLAQNRQALQLQLIRVLAQNKQPERAITVIRKIRESEPDNLLWTYQEGFVHYQAQNWEEAIKVFAPLLQKAVAEKNASIERETRYNLSRCLAFSGLDKEALQLIDETIAAEPDEMLWRYQKGWIHYYAHQWPQAIEAYEDVLKRGDDEKDSGIMRQTRFSLSATYVHNEQFDEGEKVLEVIYAENPDDISVCNDLGYLYADRNKKLNQAYEMIQKAVDAEPENKAYLDSLGWVLYRRGDYEKAREYLEKAVVGSESGDSVLWDHLGDCYDKLGLTDKARDAWKTALEHEDAEKYPNEKLRDQLRDKLK